MTRVRAAIQLIRGRPIIANCTFAVQSNELLTVDNLMMKVLELEDDRPLYFRCRYTRYDEIEAE